MSYTLDATCLFQLAFLPPPRSGQPSFPSFLYDRCRASSATGVCLGSTWIGFRKTHRSQQVAEAAETGNPRGNNDGFEAGTLRYLIPVREFNDAPFCKAGLTNGSVVQGADFSVHPVSPPPAPRPARIRLPNPLSSPRHGSHRRFRRVDSVASVKVKL